MSHVKKIAQNAAWLLAATTAQKAIAFVAFTVIARLVGPSVTGEYHFAISITSIFVTLADLGLTPVVIRETAADESKGLKIFGRALLVKSVLVPMAALLAIAYAFFTGVSGDTFTAVVIAACFVMSADSVSLIWYAVIRGRRELRYEALGMFIGQILTASVGITSAYLGFGVIGLAWGLAAGSLWNVGWSVAMAYRLKLWPADGSAILPMVLLRQAFPFALAGIFVKVYSYVDSLMLKAMHGSVAVGQYAVAYKLTYALQFLPLAFVAALYPGLANVAEKEREALKPIVNGSLRLMMIASVPMAALLSALSPRLIPLLYGPEFSGSILPLMVLPWVLIPIFLDFPIGSLLNATHRAGQKTTAMGITMTVNFVLNFLLIPIMGPVGAAWAGVGSFIVLFGCGWYFARNDIDAEFMVPLLLRGLGCAAFTWIGTHFLIPPMTDIFAFTFGISIATVGLFVFGLLTVSDVLKTMKWLHRRATAPATEDEALHDK